MDKIDISKTEKISKTGAGMYKPVNMTAMWLRQLKNPDQGRVIYKDAGCPGLMLRVGVKKYAWYVHYKIHGTNKVRDLKIGEYPEVSLQEARRITHEIMAQVRDGLDPAYEKKRQIQKEIATPTVAEFAQTYLDLWALPNKAPKSAQEDQRQLEQYILPAIGYLKMDDVAKEHLVAILDKIGRRAPVQANRTRALLSKFFNFAVDRGILRASPAFRLPRYAKEMSRERVLTEEEIKIFWHGTERLSYTMRGVLRLLLLTGQRRGEVIAMRWDEIDTAKRLWIIPGGRTKNGQPNTVPLSGLAWEIISTRPREGDYVFPGTKNRKHLHVESTGPAMTKLRRFTGLDVRPHDLRRTCATYLTSLGCPSNVLKRILNHVESGNVTRVYDRYSYLDEKRLWMDKWDRKVKEILGMDTGKVVEFPRKVA